MSADRCPRCGRIATQAGVSLDPHRCPGGASWLCRDLANAYRRGLREGVEVAKGHASIENVDGHRYRIDWSDVDAEIAGRTDG